MADAKSPGGRKPLPRKPQPKPTSLLDEAFDSIPAPAAPATLPAYPGKRAKQSWVKKNFVLITSIGVGVGLLLFILLLGGLLGWFSGSPAKPLATAKPKAAAQRPAGVPKTSPAAPAHPATAAKSPTTTPQKTPKPAQKPSLGLPTKPQSPNVDPAKSAKQQSPPLTDDFKKWRNADWSRARREHHAKLREAIVYLGSEKFAGKESVANGLIGLLKPLPPEKPAAAPSPGASPAPGTFMPSIGNLGGQPRNMGDTAAVVDAIVTALGDNGSDIAQKTIREVLAGTFRTDDDKTAVESAVRALVAHPSADNDALLVRLLITPELVRSVEHEGPWPAKTLQSKTFELVKQSQSVGLRTAMAKAVIDRRETLNAEDSMHKLLLEESPLNCSAQVLFYTKAAANGELRSKLERQLLGYSSQAMARCLHLSDVSPSTPTALPPASRFAPAAGFAPSLPTAPPSGSPAGQLKADRTIDLAAELWTKNFRDSIESELGKASLEKQATLLLLAATMPQDSTRALLARALKKRIGGKVSEEPAPLESAGLIDKVVTDPAMLVLLKLSRKDNARGGRIVDKSRLPDAARKKAELDEKWGTVTQKLIESWCRRFDAAGQGEPDKKLDGAAESVLPAGWKLGPNGSLKATYHLAWPDEAPPAIAKLKPGFLSVHYLRIEENGKPRRVTEFYRGQAGASLSDVRNVGNNTWIDKIGIVSGQKDHRRSVDVWITNPQGAAAPTIGFGAAKTDRAKAEAETDLTVEVLIVEIKDPGKD